MSNSIVSTVYRHVIDDVINQVRGDFEEMGIDDNVLNELQRVRNFQFICLYRLTDRNVIDQLFTVMGNQGCTLTSCKLHG